MFVMGTGDGHKTADGKLHHGGTWRDTPDYPLPEARPTRYYLHAGGGLSATAPAEQDSSTTFEFDPRTRCPPWAAASAARQIMADGARNQWGGEHTWTWPAPIPLSARTTSSCS